MMRFVLFLSAALAILFPNLVAAPASAAAVVIWPVDPVIAAGQQSAVLWLENRGSDPVTLQVRSLGWSQTAGEESYARQNEVVASPPLAEVAPGQRQLVRLIRRAPPTGTALRAYRLLIDEVPRPIEAGAGHASAHLAVQMRYSIPLFAFATAKAAPQLSARIVTISGHAYVEVSNSGAGHARLTDLRIVTGATPTVLTAGLVGYVLPGATMRWPLPETARSQGTLLLGVNGTDQTFGASL